jgi:hypothetical protein
MGRPKKTEDLTPQQKGAITKRKNKLAAEAKAKAKKEAEKIAAENEARLKEAIDQEEAKIEAKKQTANFFNTIFAVTESSDQIKKEILINLAAIFCDLLFKKIEHQIRKLDL